MTDNIADDGDCLPREKNVAPNGWIIVSRREDQSCNELGILQRQCNCNRGAPGMAEHDCSRDANLSECFINKVCLRFGRPYGETRPLTIAKSRPIKRDDLIFLSRFIQQAA